MRIDANSGTLANPVTPTRAHVSGRILVRVSSYSACPHRAGLSTHVVPPSLFQR